MRRIGIIACTLGAFGIIFGAFGAHSIKSKIDPTRYAAYRVGIEYLFFHLAPLLYIATHSYSKYLERIGYLFVLGIICFTGSNLLMTTEAIHHINFHPLWPITPLGGILLLLGWGMLAKHFINKKD